MQRVMNGKGYLNRFKDAKPYPAPHARTRNKKVRTYLDFEYRLNVTNFKLRFCTIGDKFALAQKYAELRLPTALEYLDLTVGKGKYILSRLPLTVF